MSFNVNRIFPFIIVLIVLWVGGCKNDDTITTPTTSDTGQDVELRFYPKFGANPLALNQKFRNAAGDSVWFTALKFYLSETALVDSLGGEHALEGDEHTHKLAHEITPNIWMVDFDSVQFTNGYFSVMVNGEPGKYRGIKFSIGVPYDLNHRDASLQDPPLGPNSGMYWGWNPGYIFNMMEGKVDSAGTALNFGYHLGTDNRKATITLATLTGTVTEFIVSNNDTTQNVFSVDVDYSKIFTPGLNGASAMLLSQDPTVRTHHVGPANLADRTFANSATMFARRP